MVGLQPSEVPPTTVVKFLGAGTAACFADLLTFPLDTAKVRLQVGAFGQWLRFPRKKGLLLPSISRCASMPFLTQSQGKAIPYTALVPTTIPHDQNNPNALT